MQQKLTRREKEIFTLLLEGSVPKEIAGKLKISNETVLSHQKKLYRKLGVHSVEELAEKYRDRKDEVAASNGNGKHSEIKRIIKPKYLIAAGIAAVVLLFIFISLTQRHKGFIDPPRVYLDDGTYFTIHTFDNVPLYTDRWVQKENEWYGENYSSSDRIKFKDIYNGTIDNLVPNPSVDNYFRFRLSGNVDKELKFVKIDIHFAPGNGTNWIHLGGTMDDQLVNIGPGDFSEVFTFSHKGIDSNTLPEYGVYYFSILSNFYYVYNKHIFETGERLPDDVPDNTIWATINNLKIEPLDKLAK